MTKASERERIAALTAGLAATIIIWIFAAAYAPATLERLGDYSPWLYGPVSTLAWALFSAIAYLVIRPGADHKSASHAETIYRCRELRIPPAATGGSVCANRDEKNHLAAVTAGFALTITTWVAALSVSPTAWLDTLSAAPAWWYCAGTVGLWATLSTVIYALFRDADRRRYGDR